MLQTKFEELEEKYNQSFIQNLDKSEPNIFQGKLSPDRQVEIEARLTQIKERLSVLLPCYNFLPSLDDEDSFLSDRATDRLYDAINTAKTFCIGLLAFNMIALVICLSVLVSANNSAMKMLSLFDLIPSTLIIAALFGWANDNNDMTRQLMMFSVRVYFLHCVIDFILLVFNLN